MWLVEEKTWVFLILTILILEHVILETLSLLHAGMKKHGRHCCPEDVTSPMQWSTENIFSLLCRILKGLNLTDFVENVSETTMI